MSQSAAVTPAVPQDHDGHDAPPVAPPVATVVVETVAALAVGLVALFPLYAVLDEADTGVSHGGLPAWRIVALAAPIAVLVVSAALSLVLPARLRGWPGVVLGLSVAAATMLVAAWLADGPEARIPVVWRPYFHLCHAAAGGVVLGSCLAAVLHRDPGRPAPRRTAPVAGLAVGVVAAAAFVPVALLVGRIRHEGPEVAGFAGWPYWRLARSLERPVPVLVVGALALSVAAAVVTWSRVPSRPSGRLVAVVCGLGVVAAGMSIVDHRYAWALVGAVGPGWFIALTGGAVAVAVAVLTWTARRLDGPAAGRWCLVVCGCQPLIIGPALWVAFFVEGYVEQYPRPSGPLYLAALAAPAVLPAAGALAGVILARRRAFAWEAVGLTVAALTFGALAFGALAFGGQLAGAFTLGTSASVVLLVVWLVVWLGGAPIAGGFTQAVALSRTSAAGVLLGLAGAPVVAPLFGELMRIAAHRTAREAFFEVSALSGLMVAAAIAVLAWWDRRLPRSG